MREPFLRRRSVDRMQIEAVENGAAVLRIATVTLILGMPERVEGLFAEYGNSVALVIHTAAQPSHDWAARDPHVDFSVNAVGTLNLLEATRKHCPDAPFIFTSTNKVYGDTPNRLPLMELDTRWEIDPTHEYWVGIDERMSIDQTLHSLFGASKVSADNVGARAAAATSGAMKTACFRGGWLEWTRTTAAPNGARLPGLPDALHGHWPSIHCFQDTRVSGYATTSTAPTLINSLPPNSSGNRARAGSLQHRRRPFQQCLMMESSPDMEEVAAAKLGTSTHKEDNRNGDPYLSGLADTRASGNLSRMEARKR